MVATILWPVVRRLRSVREVYIRCGSEDAEGNYAPASPQAIARGRPLRPIMAAVAAAAMNARMTFARRVGEIPTTLMSFYAPEPLRRKMPSTKEWMGTGR
jgi:hypothetical protein